MKIWGKTIRKTKIIKSIVVENYDFNMSRTEKVFAMLSEICEKCDLQTPIWHDLNIKDFKRFSKTRFTKDSFIETIDFDYLDFQVIEEDY